MSFAVFILSRARADRVHTLDTLRRDGYTGKWYVIVGTDDDTIGDYRKRYEEHVITFDKNSVEVDTGDIMKDMRAVVFARNACFNIAKSVGVTHFLVLDDDYVSFEWRYEDGGKLKEAEYDNLDEVFKLFCDFLDSSGAITVAMAQGGDYIGGVDSGSWRKGILRKAMNSFFCRVDRPFRFYGRINEDTNMYVVEGGRGRLVMTVTDACIVQKATQSNAGGLTDIYLDNGTYLKSFYSVMYAPSCVKVCEMGAKHKRIHHRVNWDSCCPKIISERWRKRDGR